METKAAPELLHSFLFDGANRESLFKQPMFDVSLNGIMVLADICDSQGEIRCYTVSASGLGVIHKRSCKLHNSIRRIFITPNTKYVFAFCAEFFVVIRMEDMELEMRANIIYPLQFDFDTNPVMSNDSNKLFVLTKLNDIMEINLKKFLVYTFEDKTPRQAWCMALSEDDKILVVYYFDRRIRRYDVEKHTLIAENILSFPISGMGTLFSPNQISMQRDDRIMSWDMKEDRLEELLSKEHRRKIDNNRKPFAVNRGKTMFAYISWSSLILEDKNGKKVILKDYCVDVLSLSFTSSGKRLTLCDKSGIYIYSATIDSQKEETSGNSN